MILTSPYTLSLTSNYSTESLNKGTWLVVLHASRIPPHIGLLIDGSYNSLTIKGQELDVAINVLLKTIQLKKIEAIFISLIKQPVFSTSFQLEIAKHFIQQYHQVKANLQTQRMKVLIRNTRDFKILHQEMLILHLRKIT